VDDLADLYVRAVERGAGGEILNGTDGAHHRVRDIAGAFATAGGWTVSEWPLEEARATLGGLADALAMDQQVSSARAGASLGWKPRHRSVVAEAEALLRAVRA
jgi:nucleoside-diphosphate-sugar epimerase